MFTMDDLLEIAVKMEKNGETVYINSAKKLCEPELVKMVEWMASEEASHAKWFTRLKNSLELEINEADLKAMVPKTLQDMMGENTLSLDEINFSNMSSIDELLQTFIGFEQDTIAFYEVLEMFIDDETVLKGLKQIIQEEKNHIKTLESKKDSFSDQLIIQD